MNLKNQYIKKLGKVSTFPKSADGNLIIVDGNEKSPSSDSLLPFSTDPEFLLGKSSPKNTNRRDNEFHGFRLWLRDDFLKQF